MQSAVQLPLAQMAQFVVQRVQDVGVAVLEELHNASSALAPPTIQESRAKKFEFIPSELLCFIWLQSPWKCWKYLFPFNT